MSSINCARFKLYKDINLSPLPVYDVEIAYELYGWEIENNGKHVSTILRRIHTTDVFRRFTSATKSETEFRIQIVYEDSRSLGIVFDQPEHPLSHRIENNPIEYIIYIGNRIFSIQSGLVIPVYKRNNDLIRFRLWKKNKFLTEVECSVDHFQVFGWLPLFLIPFDDRQSIQNRYQDCTDYFLRSKELESHLIL
ncbi:hypothetical protein [Leptospira sp. GIMC2001]|uniref:hypothetical protein n=1 Tax=Leptospira sp. GIMC2001 TaxID=1513297 RepID=UPI00234A2064|nr:hypothetical protein [Leptospira sp. GIMC2001]WCL49746.1 hypothetical protein O4O04_02690 [Leptospira sp. GIMC2001]